MDKYYSYCKKMCGDIEDALRVWKQDLVIHHAESRGVESEDSGEDWKTKAGIETVKSVHSYEVYSDGANQNKVENKTYGFAWGNYIIPANYTMRLRDTIEKVAFLGQYNPFEKELGAPFTIIDASSHAFKTFTDKTFINQRDKEIEDKMKRLPLRFVCMPPWERYVFQERRPWETNQAGGMTTVSARFAFAPMSARAIKLIQKD